MHSSTSPLPDLPASAQAAVSTIERLRIEHDFVDRIALDRSWRITGFGPLDNDGDRQYLEAERLAAPPAASPQAEPAKMLTGLEVLKLMTPTIQKMAAPYAMADAVQRAFAQKNGWPVEDAPALAMSMFANKADYEAAIKDQRWKK